MRVRSSWHRTREVNQFSNNKCIKCISTIKRDITEELHLRYQEHPLMICLNCRISSPQLTSMQSQTFTTSVSKVGMQSINLNDLQQLSCVFEIPKRQLLYLRPVRWSAQEQNLNMTARPQPKHMQSNSRRLGTKTLNSLISRSRTLWAHMMSASQLSLRLY